MVAPVLQGSTRLLGATRPERNAERGQADRTAWQPCRPTVGSAPTAATCVETSGVGSPPSPAAVEPSRQSQGGSMWSVHGDGE